MDARCSGETWAVNCCADSKCLQDNEAKPLCVCVCLLVVCVQVISRGDAVNCCADCKCLQDDRQSLYVCVCVISRGKGFFCAHLVVMAQFMEPNLISFTYIQGLDFVIVGWECKSANVFTCMRGVGRDVLCPYTAFNNKRRCFGWPIRYHTRICTASMSSLHAYHTKKTKFVT